MSTGVEQEKSKAVFKATAIVQREGLKLIGTGLTEAEALEALKKELGKHWLYSVSVLVVLTGRGTTEMFNYVASTAEKIPIRK